MIGMGNTGKIIKDARVSGNRNSLGKMSFQSLRVTAAH